LSLWAGELIPMHRYALLHHKCGTTYVKKILKKICHDLNIGFLLYKYPPYEKEQQIPAEKKFYSKIKQLLSKRITKKDSRLISFVNNSRYEKLFHHMTGPYKGFHIVRDPRDIIVSGYFSHLHSHPVKNRWGTEYLIEHRRWLESVSKNQGLLEEIKRGYALNPISRWNYNNPDILEVKFEILTLNPGQYFGNILDHLDIKIQRDHLDSIIELFSFKRLSGGRSQGEENVKSHFRKGIPGDWKNHFNKDHIDLFKEKWGDLLIKLKYEADDNWGNDD